MRGIASESAEKLKKLADKNKLSLYCRPKDAKVNNMLAWLYVCTHKHTIFVVK